MLDDYKHLVTENIHILSLTFSEFYFINICPAVLIMDVWRCLCRSRCETFCPLGVAVAPLCVAVTVILGIIADGQITVCVTKKGHVAVFASTPDSEL